jgi:ESS family glutamate:Na+ symporter
VRNVAILLGIEGTSDRAVRAVGSVSLSLFLIIALMTLRIVDLATVAGPLLLIILVNSLATAAFAYFLTFRYMGGDYDAAAISGGAGRGRGACRCRGRSRT